MPLAQELNLRRGFATAGHEALLNIYFTPHAYESTR